MYHNSKLCTTLFVANPRLGSGFCCREKVRCVSNEGGSRAEGAEFLVYCAQPAGKSFTANQWCQGKVGIYTP